MIGDTENPLTEVALALSMAFFSLMVLMLFAITNTPNSSTQKAVKIQSSAETEAEQKSPTYLIFFEGQYFNELLEPCNVVAEALCHVERLLIITEPLCKGCR